MDGETLLQQLYKLLPRWLDRLLAQRGLAQNSCLAYEQDLTDFLGYLGQSSFGLRKNASVEEDDILLYLATLSHTCSIYKGVFLSFKFVTTKNC